MTPLQNMPGKIVGGDVDARTITIQIPVLLNVTMGDAVVVSSAPEIAPRVGDVDREAASKFLLNQQDREDPFSDTMWGQLEIAFARHRENATR